MLNISLLNRTCRSFLKHENDTLPQHRVDLEPGVSEEHMHMKGKDGERNR